MKQTVQLLDAATKLEGVIRAQSRRELRTEPGLTLRFENGENGVGFDSYARIVPTQLRPETDIRFCTSKPSAHAKQEQLVRFGMLRAELVVGALYERLVCDTCGRVKFHRTGF